MRNLKVTLVVAAGVLALASGGVTQAATNKTPDVRAGNATIVVAGNGGMTLKGGPTAFGHCSGKTGAVSIQIAGGAVPAMPAKPIPAMPMLARIGFGGLKVTSVNGSTILGTQLGSTTAVTVTVGVTTTYTEAGQSATLADVHPGSNVAVCGTPETGNTIQASSVSILLPQVQGVITAVNGSTFTVTGMDGSSHLVSATPSTTVKQLDAPAALGNLAVGTAILATGNYQSDHSLLAMSIDIQLPSVAGTVTAINGTSITVDSGNSEIDGSAPAIVTSAQTTYGGKGDAAATATSSSVKVGSFISATGTESTDGTTLNALRVVVLPDGIAPMTTTVTTGSIDVPGVSEGSASGGSSN
jgi:hypothetical protein